MPLRPEHIAAAEAVQQAAAHDGRPTVRLVAGPGTGKSEAIAARVGWLISQGVPAPSIRAVSFTRASAADLGARVQRLAAEPGYESAAEVRVTTLHSLALSLLQAAHQLDAYPVRPRVLDDWETEHIFDAEFADTHSLGVRRRVAIRRQHEAIWSTGEVAPPNYVPPNPPVTDQELADFTAFHGPRTQTYACVLPGEIVRQCVEQMAAGLLDPAALLDLRHLIVDEFQDLNPMDLLFIGHIVHSGVTVFVAGDDDQSLYSFRFASPAGIQTFPADYPGTAEHTLSACFRCPPQVLAASTALIGAFSGQNRIAKAHHSLYATADPPVSGAVCRWKFASHKQEAEAVAASCRALIAREMRPRDILILLSNQRVLAKPILDALEEAGVPAEHPREEGITDGVCGRLVLSLLRIVCSPDDYVARRTLLGLRRGVGVSTCNRIAGAVIANMLNYRAVFDQPLPGGVFGGRELSALDHARAACIAVAAWQPDDTLSQRADELAALLTAHDRAETATEWQAFAADLPPGITLRELLSFLTATGDEARSALLEGALVRLNQEVPEAGPLPQRVRVMTMHGAKGLSARVVFIPGLEEQVMPGPRKAPYPGLVLEAARMLYVSLTRARAACVVSFATRRAVQGSLETHSASRFAAHLGGPFCSRYVGLTDGEVAAILGDCANL